MPKHYTTNQFFRQMPSEALHAYFQHKGLLLDFDFDALPEGKIGPLFEAWLGIPESDRQPIDAEFKEIFEMSCEKGFCAIRDEAEFHISGQELTEFIEKMSALPSHEERAMVTFLEHPHLWKGATYFYHADSLAYWKKRQNLPNKPAAVDEASIKQLARLISEYFHFTEGRGKNCVVEPFRRHNLDYFFAYVEGFSDKTSEWVDNQLVPRPHNPAFEVIYVYSQNEGTLDLNFQGNYKAIEPLQAIFAEAILKSGDLPPDPKDQRVYELSLLVNRHFEFVYDGLSGIEKVAVKKLRFSSKINKGDRIIFEANVEENPHAIYDVLDQASKSLPLTALYSITQVELAASVKMDAHKPAKKVTIRITYPNSCSLKYDDLGLKLRHMLLTSGIEPKLPTILENEVLEHTF